MLITIAGFVDAVGYVLLAHVFIANMSGNSVAVGLNAAEANWAVVWHRGYPVATFVLGLLAGGIVAELQRRRRVARAVGWTLLLETVLLAGFVALGGALLGWHARRPPIRLPYEVLLVGLPAMAMGVQNVCLRASGVMNVNTTHVTGALTKLADDAVQYGLWLHHRARPRPVKRRRRWRRVLRASIRHPSFRDLVFLGAIWSMYVIGALAGGWSLNRWGLVAVTVPLGAVALIAAWELGYPRRSSE